MAIFGEERRIINQADDTLPFITPGFEPGPGHYKNEIQTRLTTALEVQAARPGERRSTFGITERHRGPWSYIGDPKKLAESSPGPIYNVDTAEKEYRILSDRHTDFITLYEETLDEIDKRRVKTAEATKRKPVLKTNSDSGVQPSLLRCHSNKGSPSRPSTTLSKIKPREAFAKRFKSPAYEGYKYLVGPGSYEMDEFNQNSKSPVVYSRHNTSFGRALSVGSPQKKKEANSLLPQHALVYEQEGYVGPKADDKRRDYQCIYEQVADQMEKTRIREENRLGKRGKKYSRYTKSVKSPFKPPCPGFGSAARFPVTPPTKIFALNLPGPGSYDQNKRTDISHKYGIGTPRIKKRDEQGKMEDILSKGKRHGGNISSSFSGKGRDTMEMMRRFGKAPAFGNPSANDYFDPKNSQFITFSNNIRVFEPPREMSYNKKPLPIKHETSFTFDQFGAVKESIPRCIAKQRNIERKQADLKILESMKRVLFDRASAPSLSKIQEGSLIERTSSLALTKSLNLSRMRDDFFSDVNVIRRS